MLIVMPDGRTTDPGRAKQGVVAVSDYFRGGWSAADPTRRALECCEALEHGRILLFRDTPFELSPEDRRFLVSQQQTESRFHKNISYRPVENALHGATQSRSERAELATIMARYSRNVTNFVRGFLAPYANGLRTDYASFRPCEERSRVLPWKKRNDLLHIDAFPTRPTRGARILRVFTNLNHRDERVWLTGEPFYELAQRFAKSADLASFALPGASASTAQALRNFAVRLGLPGAARSSYDRFMLHFHDWLKQNAEYQQSSPTQRVEFAPGATWLVYTDGVAHAVVSGQYALEHTYIVPPELWVSPQVGPLRVLEQIAGAPLSN